MAKRNSSFKAVVVKEHPVQSIREAGLYKLKLPDGAKITAVANSVFPHHDESFIQLILRHIADQQPDLLVIQGYMFDESAFQLLADTAKNILHKTPRTEALTRALQQGLFEGRVRSLAHECSQFIRRFADAAPNATVVYLPAWANMGLSSEHGIVDFIINKKQYLDSWTDDHLEAPERPSNPLDTLPSDFAELFELNGDPQIQVLPYGAGLMVNDETLFLDGAFRRRHAGDASLIQWQQMGYSIVQSIDGKASSAWATTPIHTMPEPIYKSHCAHEIGYTWDPRKNGQYGDYHRRCPGFFAGTVFFNKLFGNTIVPEAGADGRRSIWVHGKTYTEESPGMAIATTHMERYKGKSKG
jgi:hypothetical protein